MSLPTRAQATIDIAAAPTTIYDLVTDVTRMGEWSPECVSCVWLTDERGPGARFRGRNRRGPARWSTIAEVLVADRGREFSFSTLHRSRPATRWTYRFEAIDGGTRMTESFEALHTPAVFGLVERLFIRDRQHQLEEGIERTIAAMKAATEALQRGTPTVK
jgi:hypothetical protein